MNWHIGFVMFITSVDYPLHEKLNMHASVILQVEVKIDNSLEKRKGDFLNDFKLEAVLFDTGNWNNHEGLADLLSSNVANVKLSLLSTTTTALGFHGYVLGGRLEKPKLWSAEQVMKIIINLLVSLLFLCHYMSIFNLSFPS